MPPQNQKRELPGDVPFRLCRSADYESMSRAAAEYMADRIRRKPETLMVLATGGSPERAYGLLAQQGRKEPGLCGRLRIMKLDEWGGLEMEDPATCEAYLRRTLAGPLGLGPDRFFGWQSQPADVAEECRRVRQLLEEHGPADLCVLGLGLNGHLGFNEPAEHLCPGPHRAELSEVSRQHGMLKQARSRPLFGLTLGMRDILGSREVLLLVSGEQKRPQLRRLLQPEISPQFPASFLWLHPALTIFCDEAAL